MTEPQNAFPIRPQPEDDPRFQPFLIDAFGLLEKHGYPKGAMTSKDCADFMMALWRFLYSEDR